MSGKGGTKETGEKGKEGTQNIKREPEKSGSRLFR